MKTFLPAALLLLAAGASAQDDYQRVKKLEEGWAIETGPLVASKDAAARHRRADAALAGVFGFEKGDTAFGQSFAAMLTDTTGPDPDLVGVQAFLQTRRGLHLYVNRLMKDGSILELKGDLAPDPSGLAPAKHGVVMSMRRVQKLDEETTPFTKQRQYFGPDAVLQYRAQIGVDTNTRLTQGAQVTRTISYLLQRRDVADWSWLPETKEARGQIEIVHADTNAVELLRSLSPVTLVPAMGGKIPCASADLSAQYFDEHERHQGNQPVCHAFAAIALLEAALKRAYGVKVPLSERDLVNQLFPDGEVEGGRIGGDIDFAVKHGVASHRLFGKGKYPAGRRPSAAEEARRGLGRSTARPEERWWDQPQAMKSDVDAERTAVQHAFYNAGIESTSWIYTPLTMGVSQKYELIRILCSGEPAGVGMQLGGLEAWGAQGELIAGHAFVVVGFEQKDGKFVFQTRNSWGGKNPDVQEDQLWRVLNITRARVGKPTSYFAASKGELAALGE